jgi:cell division protein FtsW
MVRQKNLMKNLTSAPYCPWPLPSKGIDLLLLIMVVALVLFGLIMVYSSSFIYAQEKTGNGYAFIEKQLVFAVMGFVGLLFACRVDYRFWSRWAYVVLGFSTFLLVLIMVPGIGSKVGGAQRWIRVGGFGFQPGELVKFAVILFVAFQLDKKRDRLSSFTASVLSHVVLCLPSLVLLILQPDFGTTVMISIVVFCLMFLGGVPKKFLFPMVLTIITAAVALIMSSPYRMDRLLAFWNPWKDPSGKGFQILQSFIGLHNGSLWGVGLGNGKEKLLYLPEAHNDFIFAVIGEELGFLGIVAVIATYLYFVYRGLQIAWDCQRKYQDRFGMLLAAGISLALGVQGFVNMAVVLGLLPTKGLTLPFISYGGSALIVDLLAVGVLLSIARGPQKTLEKKPVEA